MRDERKDDRKGRPYASCLTVLSGLRRRPSVAVRPLTGPERPLYAGALPE